MSAWNKKQISKIDVEQLSRRYKLDPLTASIFVRRGLTQGREILYFMESDMRFQHSPFSFSAMEDAVDRILQAKEDGGKVLIFGDRDVDGITATTVLHDCLSSLGIDVSYRLPLGDDGYGLSMAAVDDFVKEDGSLIITVDCGISNNQEIAHAAELGLDVIVLDHHNPPAELPTPAIIVDPKLPDSGYPFHDISGCAVVFKTVSAIRFSFSPWYKQEVCLFDAREKDGNTVVDCVKLRNLVPVSRMSETIVPGERGLMDTRLPTYLQGQQILVWDEKSVRNVLAATFGTADDFNFLDIRPEAGKIIPKVGNLPLRELKKISRLARYGDHEATEIGGFYNIYVTYVNQCQKIQFPEFVAKQEDDLQLVALAALADVMPMLDENRIFVRNALASINAGKIRPGLMELMARVGLLGKRVTANDLSWVLVSHLNAAGRLGMPELAAELFLTKDTKRREDVAQQILELNTKRKQLCSDAMDFGAIQAKNSLSLHNEKLCVVIDSRINRGVCGILAGRLVSAYDVPAMVVTVVDDMAIGSMRSCRGFSATDFLDGFGDIFLNHGGHDAAAGFSLKKDRLEEFKGLLQKSSEKISLGDSRSGIFDVDAEVPLQYMTPRLIEIADMFEPSGEENPQLLFMAKGVPVVDAMLLGKGEKQHLKIMAAAGNVKWPCLFWDEGERLHRDFEVGDDVDILFNVSRNIYNGMESLQLILKDLKKSSAV
ncbi:MAG: single-stranded-DNA-specific exonuclease RecJ [Treponema sp.]|nr:single-stranded-DNA-specific exonuclease RecJ [Treponema sp.]